MGALKLPQILGITAANKALCARIGVRLDGMDLGETCGAYHVPNGKVLIKTKDGMVERRGIVEPYWRTNH
jgi:hypothetical protein